MEHEKKHKEDKIEKSTEEKEKVSNKKENLTDKIKENPWVVSTIVLGIACLIFLFGNFSGFTGSTVTGSVVNEETAGENVEMLLENVFNLEGELVNIKKIDDLYYITLDINGMEAVFRSTLNGEFIRAPNGNWFKFSEFEEESPPQQQPTTTEYSEEDNQKIQEFSQCLADKGLRVYYAGWCGACHNFIESFGGEQNIGEGFIKCSDANRQPTEHAELCDEKKKTSYVPEIQLNGELYEGGRTLEALGEATGCPAPQLD